MSPAAFIPPGILWALSRIIWESAAALSFFLINYQACNILYDKFLFQNFQYSYILEYLIFFLEHQYILEQVYQHIFQQACQHIFQLVFQLYEQHILEFL